MCVVIPQEETGNRDATWLCEQSVVFVGGSLVCDVTGIRRKTTGTNGDSREDHIFYYTVCNGLHWQCDCMGDLQERLSRQTIEILVKYQYM